MQILDNSCYAYPQKHMYPIHTKQAALQSYEQFKSDIQRYSKDRVDVIADKLIKAAKLHGIQFTQLQSAPRQTVKIDLQDGKSVSITKIASQQDLTQLMNMLDKNASKLTNGDIQKIAQAVFPYCDQLDMDSQNMNKLTSLAGYGVCDASQMAQQLLKRANKVQLPEKQARQVFALYREVQKNAQSDELFKTSAKVFSTLSRIDDMYKLASFYGKDLKSPTDTCYGQTMDQLISQAQDYLLVPSTNTILSKKAVLQNKQAIKDFLDEYYADSFKDDEQLFTKVASLSRHGISTLIQKLDK